MLSLFAYFKEIIRINSNYAEGGGSCSSSRLIRSSTVNFTDPMKIPPPVSCLFGVLLCASVRADDKPMLAIPGPVIYENKLDAAPGPEWKAAKGKWEAIEGSLRGSEIPADKHGAVIRLTQKLTDFVIDAEFCFSGAKSTSLSINAVKGSHGAHQHLAHFGDHSTGRQRSRRTRQGDHLRRVPGEV